VKTLFLGAACGRVAAYHAHRRLVKRQDAVARLLPVRTTSPCANCISAVPIHGACTMPSAGSRPMRGHVLVGKHQGQVTAR